MGRILTWLGYVLLVAGIVLEMILVASQENLHHQKGHEAGVWAIRMGPDAAQLVSWAAVVCIGLVFIEMWAQVRFHYMLGMIAVASMVEVLWGHDLPRPQNQWGYAAAFLVGALAMFIRAVSRTNFVANARAALRRIGLAL